MACLLESQFHRMLVEDGPAAANPEGVQKLIFCTGKVYYDLIVQRRDRGLDDKIAINRVEQVCLTFLSTLSIYCS